MLVCQLCYWLRLVEDCDSEGVWPRAQREESEGRALGEGEVHSLCVPTEMHSAVPVDGHHLCSVDAWEGLACEHLGVAPWVGGGGTFPLGEEAHRMACLGKDHTAQGACGAGTWDPWGAGLQAAGEAYPLEYSVGRVGC